MRQTSIVLCARIVLITAGLAGVCEADLTDGVVAYYPFSGNADDMGIYSHDGVVHGAVLTTDRHGNPNSAYYFDGGGDYISASATGLPTGERTVALWFNAVTLTTRPNLVGYGGGGYVGGGTSWLMGINHWGHLAMDMTCHWGTNTIEYYYGATPPVEAWYYYAITTDPTGTKLYVNGDLKASNTKFVNNTIVTGKNLAIGVAVSTVGVAPYQDGNTGYFRGVIDEVGIWNRALSQAEIQQLMQTDLSVVPVPGAALLGAIGLSFAGWRLKRRTD